MPLDVTETIREARTKSGSRSVSVRNGDYCSENTEAVFQHRGNRIVHQRRIRADFVFGLRAGGLLL
jgi:hypothetical protein